MPRIARLVVPGYPHHITQRGVRSMKVFFSDQDRQTYLLFLREQAAAHGIEFLAYCLMTNHVHLVAIPRHEDSFARGIGEAHRLYTRMINFRDKVRGYLFQGRFRSSVLSEEHLLYAVRYVEMNPVRAHMVRAVQDHPWSSARFRLGLTSQDCLVTDADLGGLITDRSRFHYPDDERDAQIRKKTRTGRPTGDAPFLKKLERLTGRELLPKKPGPRTVCKS